MKTLLLLTAILASNVIAQPTTASIIQLIANPDRYNGKIVRIEGVTNIEFEGNGIFLSKEHWKARVHSFALWMNLGEELAKKRKWLNGKYCFIEGTFHADDRGHGGLYMGSISDITIFDAREAISPKEVEELQK